MRGWATSLVGTRTTGGRGGTWVITPPGYKGAIPRGSRRLAAPTNQAILLGRIRAVDDADAVVASAEFRADDARAGRSRYAPRARHGRRRRGPRSRSARTASRSSTRSAMRSLPTRRLPPRQRRGDGRGHRARSRRGAPSEHGPERRDERARERRRDRPRRDRGSEGAWVAHHQRVGRQPRPRHGGNDDRHCCRARSSRSTTGVRCRPRKRCTPVR